jgi:hypothetical protein
VPEDVRGLPLACARHRAAAAAKAGRQSAAGIETCAMLARQASRGSADAAHGAPDSAGPLDGLPSLAELSTHLSKVLNEPLCFNAARPALSELCMRCVLLPVELQACV